MYMYIHYIYIYICTFIYTHTYTLGTPNEERNERKTSRCLWNNTFKILRSRIIIISSIIIIIMSTLKSATTKRACNIVSCLISTLK